ncbi:hypothetical protein [Phenylobacterium sp.]|uniref:hypothetical protein n=1 Tax=Phenylobacterium sp. TaxID=1871053 RepID=UPI003BABE17B
MNYLSNIMCIAALGLSAGGCATHEVAKLEARTTLAAAPAILPAAAASEAQASMAWGDRWTAANLFERSVEGRATALSRFNLASAYQRTGRLDEAAANYRVVTEIGKYQWASTVRDNAHQKVNVRRFNLADESARRLARLGRPVSYAALANQGALSATDVGVQASATVGGVSGRIPDQRAIELDAAAEAATGL